MISSGQTLSFPSLVLGIWILGLKMMLSQYSIPSGFTSSPLLTSHSRKQSPAVLQEVQFLFVIGWCSDQLRTEKDRSEPLSWPTGMVTVERGKASTVLSKHHSQSVCEDRGGRGRLPKELLLRTEINYLLQLLWNTPNAVFHWSYIVFLFN